MKGFIVNETRLQ